MSGGSSKLKKTIVLSLVGALALWLLWGRVLSGLRGDAEVVEAAIESSDQAEDAAQGAEDANNASLAVAAADEGIDEHLAAFASRLPEILIEAPSPLRRWYESELMTPREFWAFNAGASTETVEFESPVYFSNNPTCYVTPEDGNAEQAIFDPTSCQPHSAPTVVLGRSEAEISLPGWDYDCRAAWGWMFSRFFETHAIPPENDNEPQTWEPSGEHLKPWVLPGSFEANGTGCIAEPSFDEMRRRLGIVFWDWPIDEEAWEAAAEADLPAAVTGQPGSEDDEATPPSVTVKFTLLFVPVHSGLCVPDVVRGVGQPVLLPLDPGDEQDELVEEQCPASPWIRHVLSLHEQNSELLINDRVCLPRLPFATAIPDGDEIIARHDPHGAPPASLRAWPENIRDCHIDTVRRARDRQ